MSRDRAGQRFPYEPLYPPNAEAEDSELHTSPPSSLDSHNATSWWDRVCTTATIGYIWERAESGVRVALIGTLPAAILLFSTFRSDGSLWISQTFLISGALNAIAGRETVGLQVGYVGQFLRAAVVWIPVVMVQMQLHLYDYTAAWLVVYFVTNALMCCLMDGNTRKLAMMLLTIATMNMLRKETDEVLQVLRIGMEWLIGGLFGFVGALLPWPVFSTTLMEAEMSKVNHHVGELFHGLTKCMWTDTSLQRNVDMVHVRVRMRSVEAAIVSTRQHKEGSMLEWFTETATRRHLRDWKMNVYVELYRNEDSIRRVLEIVRDRPYIVDHAERAHLFRDRVQPCVAEICLACTLVLRHLDQCTSRHQVVHAAELFDRLEAAEAALQSQFDAARSAYVVACTTMVSTSSTAMPPNALESSAVQMMEEFVPLITFSVFSIAQICRTILRMRDAVQHSIAADWKQALRHEQSSCSAVASVVSVSWGMVLDVVTETKLRVMNLTVRRSEDDIRTVLEAVKTSLSMLAALGFYAYVNQNTAFLSGPTVIASIASTNPAEAVILAVPRLCGTLMGVVLGFFIAETATSSVAVIAGLISLIFVSRVAAQVKNIGASFTNAAFVSVSQLSVVPLTQDATMNRIQQTTFAVFIYILITMLVRPCRPTVMLRQLRAKALRTTVDVFRLNMDIVMDTADAFARVRPDSPSGSAGAVNQTINFLDLGGSLAASFVEYPREALATIEAKLKVLEGQVASCQTLMPFAAEEPRLRSIPYPSRACGEVQSALKKSLGLLRTMLLGVRLMRERREVPSGPLLGVLQLMMPCARDVSLQAKRFGALMSRFIEDNGASGMHNEVLDGSHTLSHLSATLHHMLSAGIIRIVRRSIEDHEGGECSPPHEPDATTNEDEGALPFQLDGSHGSSLGMTLGDRESAASANAIAFLRSEVLRVIQVDGLHSFTLADFDTVAASAARSWVDASGGSAAAEHSPHHPPCFGASFTCVDEVRRAKHLSAQDAEAIHTLTFIIVLWSAEMRKLLVAVQDLVPPTWIPTTRD